MNLELKPIGVVRVGLDDEAVRNSWKGVRGEIEIFPD